MSRNTAFGIVILAVLACLCGCRKEKPTEPEFPAGLVWLGPDISGWAKTAVLDARVSWPNFWFDYDKRLVWPTRGKAGTDGSDVNANAWIIAEAVPGSGKFYAATFEWLKPGGCLPKHLTGMPLGTYIKFFPSVFPSGWNPKPGQRIGLMVSGLARKAGDRTVLERSNVDWVVWP